LHYSSGCQHGLQAKIQTRKKKSDLNIYRYITNKRADSFSPIDLICSHITYPSTDRVLVDSNTLSRSNCAHCYSTKLKVWFGALQNALNAKLLHFLKEFCWVASWKGIPKSICAFGFKESQCFQISSGQWCLARRNSASVSRVWWPCCPRLFFEHIFRFVVFSI